MSLLKTSQLSSPRRKLLLIAASLLLVTPCVAGARFALSFNTNNQEPLANAELQEKKVAERRQKQEQVTVELERQAKELREQIERAPQAQRADAEGRPAGIDVGSGGDQFQVGLRPAEPGRARSAREARKRRTRKDRVPQDGKWRAGNPRPHE